MALSDHDKDRYTSGDIDARIASLYKQSSQDAPPADLDRRIIAAARGEMRADNEKPPWWMLWRVPLATAAVAVASASLIALMLHEDPERIASVVQPAGAPAVSSPQAAEERAHMPLADKRMSAEPEKRTDLDGPKEALEAARAPTEQGTERRAGVQPRRETGGTPAPSEMRSSRQAAVAPHSAPLTAPQSAGELQEPGAEPSLSPAMPTEKSAPALEPAAPATKPAPRAMLARPASSSAARQRSTEALQHAPQSLPPLGAETPPRVLRESSPPLAAAQAPADISEHVADLHSAPSEAWLERVRLLRREGRRHEAETLLAEFRKRYPNESVPIDVQ